MVAPSNNNQHDCPQCGKRGGHRDEFGWPLPCPGEDASDVSTMLDFCDLCNGEGVILKPDPADSLAMLPEFCTHCNAAGEWSGVFDDVFTSLPDSMEGSRHK